MLEVFGAEKKAVVARELTKIYESILMTELPQLIAHFEAHTKEQRGEIVLLLEGTAHTVGASIEILPETILEVLLTELPLKQAVALTSKMTNERKNSLYEKALSKK